MNLDEARECSRAVLTRREVGELLEVDERTVSRGIADGTVPSVRIGARVLIPRLPLLAMLGAEPAGGAS